MAPPSLAERVPLARLKPAPWNPRLIKDARFTNLCRSIQADPGFLEQRPILAMADGTIYAGNMRYRAVQHLKWDDVPAIVADIPEQLARERALRDNAQWGEWQDQELAELLYGLQQDGSALDLLGFEDDEIKRLLDSVGGLGEAAEDPGAQTDRADELRQKWGCEVGQVWVLGDHRLAIGDCTDDAVTSVLLRGDQPRYGMHDPPYGINVVVGSAVGGAKGFGKIGFTGAVPVNHYRPVAGDDHPFDPSHILSVCPDSVLWGANYYADKLTPQKGWLVWDKKGREEWRDNFSDCELAWTPLPITTRIYRHVWMGMVQEGERENRVHPTQKPVALFESIMRDLFKDGGTVADFYAGSGPTLLACERIGRPCRAVELDPAYGAVIIQRWVDASGREPSCENAR